MNNLINNIIKLRIYLNNLQKVTATVLLSCKGWKSDLINDINLKKINTIKLIYTWIIKNTDNK